MLSLKLKYFKQLWNYFDLFSLILPILTICLEIASILPDSNDYWIDSNKSWIRNVSSISIFAIWIKLLTFLKAY